ncbi:MAG: hypothetical protein HYZ74_03130 [Elusimicrobia bacterium]|nr:hypothetical protein [Elusimicrobiota bacterium]
MRARAAFSALALLAASCGPRLVERPAPFSRASRHFRVVSRAAPVVIRRDLDLSQVARLPGAAGSGLRTQGLTVIRHSLATHTNFRSEVGGTAITAWFDDVILELSVSSTTIYIPKEYREGTCEYNAVLQHERGHARLGREHAAAAARELEAALASADLPTRAAPLVSVDYLAVAATLKASLGRIIDPVYKSYEAEDIRRQALLDEPDPYLSVYQACKGWR